MNNMKLKELSKYRIGIYHIIQLKISTSNPIYIILRIVFDISIFIRAYTTLKEAIEFVNNNI